MVIGGMGGLSIMIWGKGPRDIRRGRTGKMATAVAVLRGVPAIHGTSRVATHGTSRVAVVFGIGQVAAAIHGTSTTIHAPFQAQNKGFGSLKQIL